MIAIQKHRLSSPLQNLIPIDFLHGFSIMINNVDNFARRIYQKNNNIKIYNKNVQTVTHPTIASKQEDGQLHYRGTVSLELSGCALTR